MPALREPLSRPAHRMDMDERKPLHLAIQFFLLVMTPTLTAQAPAEGPTRLAQAACTVQFTGNIERTATMPRPEALSVTSHAVESFDISIPGRIEEWEQAPGMIEFRFIPDKDFTEARGSFKTIQATTRSLMQHVTATLEGMVIGGMGTWYMHARKTDGKIVPQNIDATMRGRVTSSTDPNLPVDTKNVPVSVLMVPLVLTKEQHTRMPAFRFKGPSLWALERSKTPFSAQGELVFNHRGEHDSVFGSVQVTFQVTGTQ